MTETHILYHGNCADGFGGAWAAWKKLGDRASYHPVSYGDEPPELPAGATVYLIDFAYPRETILAMRERYARVVVLDHHKTAQAALAGLDDTVFDLEQSGAVLAWRHFHPRGFQAPVPPLLRYVQDRDLWRWELPGSREVSAALWSYPREFAVWDELETRVAGLATEGAAILRYMQEQTAMICHQAREGRVGEHYVPVVNATSLWSEVGEALLAQFPDAPFVGSYYETAEGHRKWSLRSRPDFDVSAVARALGGGGHAQAAGFVELAVVAGRPDATEVSA